MNRGNQLLDDALVMLARHGHKPVVSNGGKHTKVRWVDRGRRFTLVLSRSPSDENARQAARATLRRLLRNGNGGA
jgi:hypothetical protein